MDTLWQDIRYAFRNLRKTPGFTLVAMLTLALGIGASTAIFSVLENILVEPFPYPDAQRFMSIQIHDTERNEPGGRSGFSGPEFLDYVAQNRVFDRVIANDGGDVLYRHGEGTQMYHGNYVTPGTFEFLGMPALYGRVMQPADYEPGATPVFVLRYKTWVKDFGADPGIINSVFILNNTPRTLVGIMPPRFGWGDADMWIPEKPSPAANNTAYAGAFPRYWFFLGHLKPGITTKEAEADLTVLANRLSKVYPKDYPKHYSVHLQSLTDLVVGQFRTTFSSSSLPSACSFSLAAATSPIFFSLVPPLVKRNSRSAPLSVPVAPVLCASSWSKASFSPSVVPRSALCLLGAA
jgi:putative ABC transport system permease protein